MPQLERLHAANYRAHVLWSPRTTTTEPTRPEACAPQLERENPHATTREEKTRIPQLERSLCAATKIPHAATKDPTQPKINKINI